MREHRTTAVTSRKKRAFVFSGAVIVVVLLVSVLEFISVIAYRSEPMTAVLGSTSRATVTVEDVSIDYARGITSVMVSVVPTQGQVLKVSKSDFTWQTDDVEYAAVESFRHSAPETVSGGGYTTKLQFTTVKNGSLRADSTKYAF